MSLRTNNYEQSVINRLQRDMSKRDAEEALMEIREGLYGDPYSQISPINSVSNGNITREYPELRYIIWAYYNNNYNKLKKQGFGEP